LNEDETNFETFNQNGTETAAFEIEIKPSTNSFTNCKAGG
jgi:hypothetical protein